MPDYVEVVRAARETIHSVLKGRRDLDHVTITTAGGDTASVQSHGMGRDAYVVVNLPTLPGTAHLSRQEADRIVALVAHECCHVLHTDFRAWNALRYDAGGPELVSMTNWIEDVRIERVELKANKLPGLRDLLTDLENAEAWRATKARQEANAPLLGAAPGDFGAVLGTMGRAQNGVLVQGRDDMVARLTNAQRAVLGTALARLPGLTCTADAVELARDVLAGLGRAGQQGQGDDAEDGAEDDQPGAKGSGDGANGEGDQGDEGEDDQGSGDAEGQGKGQGQGDAKGDHDDGGGAKGEAAGNETGETGDGPGGEGHGSADATGEVPEAGKLKTGGGAMKDLVDAVAAREGVTPDANEATPILTYTPVEPVPLVWGGDGHAQTESAVLQSFRDYGVAHAAKLREAIPAPGVLRDQITRLIRSEERHGMERYRASGRLDRRALTRMQLDGQNVFARRTLIAGVDTAVMLLIDGSGSMDEDAGGRMGLTRLCVAKILSLHLSEACENARGKCAIGMFFGHGAHNRIELAKRFDGALDFEMFAARQTQGYTPLSVSVVAGAHILSGETARRRVMLVLTDGECDCGAASVQAACAMAEAMGVETVGLGLGRGAHVAGAFPRYVEIRRPQDLPTKGLAELVTLLDQGRDD